MRLYLGTGAHAVLQHQHLTVDEFELVLDLMDLPFHEVVHILEPSYLLVLLPLLGLGLDLESVLLFQNLVDLHRPTFLGQRLFVHPDLLLHLLVLHTDLIASVHRLGHYRER